MIFHAIGLMSGTSLDGLDICYARFEKKDQTWTFKILQAETLPYSHTWESRLKNAVHLSAPDLLALHSEYGFFLGTQVQEFVDRHSIAAVDVVASHGHTVFHQPQRHFTLQIGDGRALKNICGLPVIWDFRMQDVLMGGNGAPLVPIGDQLLFSEYDACLNIGGFSNISFLKNGKRVAFDISPVNILLNEFSQKIGMKYDQNGETARKGKVDKMVLEQLNQLEYYQAQPPKSLGSEWVSAHIAPLLQNLNPQDALATLTWHAAQQMASVFMQYNLQKVLATGGGAYNSYLTELAEQFSGRTIILPDQKIIDFKEALIFAFMGVLKILGEPNVLSSATGSSNDHSSGIMA